MRAEHFTGCHPSAVVSCGTQRAGNHRQVRPRLRLCCRELVAVDCRRLWAHEGRSLARRASGWKPGVLCGLVQDGQHHF